jgi:hypothetical protein
MMKVLLSFRLDRDIRDQIDTLAEHRMMTRSTVGQLLLSMALSDRHTFQPLDVAPNICRNCQTPRDTLRHLDNVEAAELRRQLEAQGMMNHPDVAPTT